MAGGWLFVVSMVVENGSGWEENGFGWVVVRGGDGGREEMVEWYS